MLHILDVDRIIMFLLKWQITPRKERTDMPFFIFIIVAFFLLYGLINYYIGLRLWQYLASYLPLLGSKAYWTVFWVLALSYLIGRLGKSILPESIRIFITYVGSYWLAVFVYLLLGFVLLDIIRILLRFFGVQLTDIIRQPVMGISILAILAVILIYGTWNAHNPVVTSYELSIPKNGGQVKELQVVMVSDLHLGEMNTKADLTKMVERINALDPDLVLIPGDIIDEDVGPYARNDMSAVFGRLQTSYGVYAVPGNHDHYGSQIDEAVSYLEKGGIKVLQDSYLKVADSFYIVGRDDAGHAQQNPQLQRRSLAEIMTGVEANSPIILLNHQPIELTEAQGQGVDLQLSGHTHQGQIYPGKLITSRIYEQDWGHLQKGAFHLIVSSGYGTWGPPIRTGNKPEIVAIKLKFTGAN